jgi:hypothetical protein
MWIPELGGTLRGEVHSMAVCKRWRNWEQSAATHNGHRVTRNRAYMRNIRARIERLEVMEPADIILKRRDSTHFRYRGPALSFYMDCLEDIREDRSTPLLKAVLETVSAEGCGLLWQVLQAMAHKYE